MHGGEGKVAAVWAIGAVAPGAVGVGVGLDGVVLGRVVGGGHYEAVPGAVTRTKGAVVLRRYDGDDGAGGAQGGRLAGADRPGSGLP